MSDQAETSVSDNSTLGCVEATTELYIGIQ